MLEVGVALPFTLAADAELVGGGTTFAVLWGASAATGLVWAFSTDWVARRTWNRNARTSERVRDELTAFAKDGHRLLHTASIDTYPLPEDHAQEWIDDVRAWLDANLDESYRARFESNAGFARIGWRRSNPADDIDKRDSVLNSLNFRVARLHEFLREV